MTAHLGKRVQPVGDDLFITNSKILCEGIRPALANALLVKAHPICAGHEALRQKS